MASTYDDDKGLASISFIHNEDKIHWQFEQSSDWVSDVFFKQLGQFARENSAGEFLIFPAEDQCAELIFMPKIAAEKIKQCGILRAL